MPPVERAECGEKIQSERGLQGLKISLLQETYPKGLVCKGYFGYGSWGNFSKIY